jgi:hypothetical protein
MQGGGHRSRGVRGVPHVGPERLSSTPTCSIGILDDSARVAYSATAYLILIQHKVQAPPLAGQWTSPLPGDIAESAIVWHNGPTKGLGPGQLDGARSWLGWEDHDISDVEETGTVETRARPLT